MEIFCLGLNHESAPVALRERFAVVEGSLGANCEGVVALPGFGEAVVLSTCNRIEIYAAADDDHRERLIDHLDEVYQLDDVEDVPYYSHRGSAAARHLFRVASGLDSMVLGETEILGQVKKAYANAHAAGQTGKVLNKLFQSSFQVAKHVRSNSSITRGATSVGAAAVDLAGKIFGDLSRCTVMIFGAGEMGQMVAKTLSSRGVKGLIVSNRSHDKAIELAEEMGGQAMHLDEGVAKLAQADIVITSTGAPHTILNKAEVAPALRSRRGRPLFMIDIAVPRDIEAGVGELGGVYLYDIDALQNIAADAKARREEQIFLCDRLIVRQMERLGITPLPTSGDLSKGGDESGAVPSI